MDWQRLRRLEVNGGQVTGEDRACLVLPRTDQGYADAQLDDYGAALSGGPTIGSRRNLPWRPGVELRLRARFSHHIDALVGTAGFGFWNAPFGDPTVRLPALPQSTWFFYASRPTYLPLAPDGPGRGFFASTLDASTPSALALAPLSPFVLLLNQSSRLRRLIWPAVRRGLGISYSQIEIDITQWHEYRLRWSQDGCTFMINGEETLRTDHSPQGPLGFVCWLDNQYLVATNRGRLAWGVLPTVMTQWLEVTDLRIRPRQ
jgi:hypothetical protein